MFVLAKISDVVQIAPADLSKPSIQAIKDTIHAKFANKVLQQVGLCITFWDLLSASDGLIGYGDGMVNVTVTFRLVVFRPFRGEIVQGTIIESNPEGMRVSVDFFDDIWIPKEKLMDPSEYVANERTWVWRLQDNDFFYDVGEQVRFRVEEESWYDDTPEKKIQTGENGIREWKPAKVPYTIIGSMADPYLGALLWWDQDDEGQANGDEEMLNGDATAGAEA